MGWPESAHFSGISGFNFLPSESLSSESLTSESFSVWGESECSVFHAFGIPSNLAWESLRSRSLLSKFQPSESQSDSWHTLHSDTPQTHPNSILVDVSIFFLVSCSGRGKGESEAPGGGGGSVIY